MNKAVILYKLAKLFITGGIDMNLKNWKTTVSGLLAALPQIVGLFGLPIPPAVLNGISAIGLFLIGLFAKDSNVTGGTVNQCPDGTCK